MNPRLILCILYAILIFSGSSLPGEEIPAIGGYDHLLHFMEYTGFGMALMWWRISSLVNPARSLMEATLTGSLYGISDELHQYFVPGRFPSASDWMADTAGTLAGALLLLAFFLFRSRLYRGKGEL